MRSPGADQRRAEVICMDGPGDQGDCSSRCLADRSDAPRCVVMTHNPQDLETILKEIKTDNSALNEVKFLPLSRLGLQKELSCVIRK